MTTYQTRRRTRLTPLGRLVFGVLAVAALIGLVAGAKAVAAGLGVGEPKSEAARAGESGESDLPGAEVGEHPDASVVVTYDVASRGSIEVPLTDFAREAQDILDDPAGWRSARVGFDRVEGGGDFTLWLATADQLTGFAEDCAPEYSCRVGRDVVINQDRWLHGALPGALDGIPMGEYRTMAVNHEVGHWLGLDHTACPGGGLLAPLMMQQSKGLDGCLANQYPLPEERRAPALGLG
ncbi:MAG: DUF3152 domain-containing protein [Bifidobacteriaceae bacterium]|jgi:hypothetical protein|nr:DUF3152 domain-containing protein [Bifidobacteriaceae bacterium]